MVKYIDKSVFRDGASESRSFSLCFGFTLAEVLITLGIIGIVAAMTMPVLIQKHQKQEATSKLKKFYSMMSQAILFSETQNGDMENWGRSDNLTDDDPGLANTKNYEEMKRYWDKYYAPYIKTVKTEKSEEGALGRLKVYLPDSSSMLIWNGSCMSFIYDINGDKKPNQGGKDLFNFHVCERKWMRSSALRGNLKFGPDGINEATTRDKAIEICKNRRDCSPLVIFYDNFEFKKDYPW